MKQIGNGPVAGAAGILAVLGVAIAMFSGGQPMLAEKVDAYLKRVNAQSVREQHQDISTQLSELDALLNDAQFGKLTASRQQALRERRAELSAYQAYASEVEQVPAPSTLTRAAALKAAQEQLASVKVPVEYQVAWSQTEAGERQRKLLDEFQALERAVAEMEQTYEKLNARVRELLKDSEGAGLPDRARKILADARKLPTPATLSGSTAFGFERVQEQYRLWQKNEKKLREIAALSDKP